MDITIFLLKLLNGIGITAGIILLIFKIIFIIRVWTIVAYHYYKIKDDERTKRIKREYQELVDEEKIEDEIKKTEEPKETTTLKEKVNNFLFREDE